MYDERCCIKTCCFDIVIAIVAAVLTLALGVITGVVIGEPIIPAIPAFGAVFTRNAVTIGELMQSISFFIIFLRLLRRAISSPH